jgi:TatA/E family protein of Tat protein translocase
VVVADPEEAMFGVGTQELLIILLVVLVLFGSKRIPEVARSLGTGMQSFRRVLRDAQREIDTVVLREPDRTEPHGSRPQSRDGPAPEAQAAASPAGQTAKAAETPTSDGSKARSGRKSDLFQGKHDV